MTTPDPHQPFDDQLLSAYLDGELTADERARVEEQLATDPAARKLLEELRAVSQAVQKMPVQPLGEDLKASVLRRAERAMLTKAATAKIEAADHDKARPGRPKLSPSTEAVGERQRFTIGRSRRGWLWAGLAVAAALLIMVYQGDEPPGAGMRGEVAQRGPEDVPKLRRLVDETVARDAAEPVDRLSTLSATPPDRAESFAVDTETSSPESQDGLLIVHVSARPEAVRNRAIDRVFLSNNIRVGDVSGLKSAEQESTTEEFSAERLYAGGAYGGATARAYRGSELNRPTARDSTREQLAQRKLGVDSDSSESEREPASDDRFDQLSRDDSVAELERRRSSGREPEVDVVLVEAPPDQIASCLSSLQADDDNFLAIDVEDSYSTADKQRPAAHLAIDWKKYNRGRVDNKPQHQSLRWALGELSRESGRTVSPAQQNESEAEEIKTGDAPASLAQRDSLSLYNIDAPDEAGGRQSKFEFGGTGAEVVKQARPLIGARKAKLAKNAVQVLFVVCADQSAPSGLVEAGRVGGGAAEARSSSAVVSGPLEPTSTLEQSAAPQDDD